MPDLLDRPLVVSAVFAVLCVSPLAADDWPQWRGPHRDGTSAETGVAKPWSEPGPAVVWAKEIGGGFSGVTVVDGRLYTQWSEGEDSFIVALAADDGRELWRRRGGDTYANARGDGPRSMPTVDGDRLYALTGGGRFQALGLDDGRPLWSHDLVGDYGGKLPYYGYSPSALVVGDRVVMTGGGPGKALLAFHRDDGHLLWSLRDDPAGYSSPVVFDLAGAPQLVFLTGSHIVGTTLDGGELWSYEWPNEYFLNVATPLLVAPNRVFISTSYDQGAVLLGIGRNGDDGVTVEPVWRSRVMKNHFQDSVLHDGHLYGFDNATLKCVVATTGEEKWRQRGLGKGSLLLVEGHLLVLSERGKLILAAASPAGFEALSAAQVVDERTWTSPSLADGRLYVRTESRLLSLDLRRSPASPKSAEAKTARPAATVTGWQDVRTLRMSGTFSRNGIQMDCVLWRQLPAEAPDSASHDRTRLTCHFRGTVDDTLVIGPSVWFKSFRDPVHHRGTIGDEDVREGLLRLALFAAGPDASRTPTAEEQADYSIHHYDFRDVGGLQVPFFSELDFGTSVYSLVVEDVELDPEIEPSVFDLPEAAE